MQNMKEMFLLFIRKINKIVPKIGWQSHVQADIPRYAILRTIPHRRVIEKNSNTNEIFDLYQLGIFSITKSFLTNLKNTGTGAQEIQEILELVELQPQSEYQPHYHKKSAAVIYIISGFGMLQLAKTYIPYQAGKRIEIPAGIMHGFKTNTRTLFLSIQRPPIINSATGHIDIYYDNEDPYEVN